MLVARFVRIGAIGLIALACGLLAGARAAGANDNSNDAERQVRDQAAKYLEAFNEGDAKTLAAFWTDGGVYIDEGGRSHPVGELLASEFSAASTGSSERPRGRILSSTIRFVHPEVAIEDGTSELIGADDAAPVQGRFTAVWVKRGKRWLLDSLRESPTAVPSNYAHLSELEWLIGKWSGQSDETAIEVDAHWSENRNFIVCEFKAEDPQRGTFTGIQRIGWDPLHAGLRSWTFDSTGGFNEGRWYREPDGWRVELTGTSSEGHPTSVTNYFHRAADGGWTLRSVNASAGDEALVDRTLTLRRAQPSR